MAVHGRTYRAKKFNPDPNERYVDVRRVAPALRLIREAGITAAIPVAQERWAAEDYHP